MRRLFQQLSAQPQLSPLTFLACLLLSACAARAPQFAVPEPRRAVPETVPRETSRRPAEEAGTGPITQVRIAAVGDIMLGGTAASEMRKYGYDRPFAHAKELFGDADIVFANLEGPLTNAGEPAANKRYVFHSPPDKVVPALARAGVNVVSLANNHVLDYGTRGLRQTIEALERVGIRHAGAGANEHDAREPALIKIRGTTVAVLAYSLTYPKEFWATAASAGTAFGHKAHVRSDVRAARRLADIVVVSFHWGQESTTVLRPYQPLLAHAAIDAGASLVLGHHPHVLQGIERYGGGVVLYSLGNFAFGSYSEKTTRSAVARVTFCNNRLSSVRLVPINVRNTEVVFQPTPLTGREADKVVAELQKLSRALGAAVEDRGGVAVLDVPGDDCAS